MSKSNLLFDIPENKKIRVIIDTDAACEADDQFAIAQALLSPKLIVKGITAEHFNEEGSMEKSYREINTILELMDMQDDVPAFLGQTGANDTTTSEAVDFIIKEANKENEKPLFVLCQGAITNVSKALTICPEIASKMTIIWVGTHGAAPCKAPFREFNAGNDIVAANNVLSCGGEVWLVPSTVYSTILISIAEIQRRVLPCGKIGEHLFRGMVDYNNGPYAGWTQGESWSLGDSPAIALAMYPGCGHFINVKAPIIAEDTSSLENENGMPVRIYTDVDPRFILEDMIAKLEIFTGR